jgi:hypothetical protein
MATPNTDQLNSLINLTETQLADNKQDLLGQILQMDKTVDDYGRVGWEFYVRFGFAFAKLKFLYFSVCFQCQPKNPCMFDILSCPKCTRVSDSTSFFKDVRRKTKYSQSYINTLIRIAALGVKYPKVKLTPWNFRSLSKFMTFLPDQMEQDRQTWV